MVGEPRECEKQIGEPVEIHDDDGWYLDLALEMDHAAFGAPTNCARDMKNRCLEAPSGKDEGSQRLELPVALVDRVLELANAIVINARLGEVLLHFLTVGSREQRADAEEIALDRNEHFVYARHYLHGARHAEDGIELIDVAVRFYA